MDGRDLGIPTTTVYTLFESSIEFEWSDLDLLSSSTSKHCGEPVLVLLYADGSEINRNWFLDDETQTSENRSFTILEQGMPSSLGQHDFIIRAYFSQAPFNYIDSEPQFSVEIVDPCESPVITYPALVDQVHMISDPESTYAIKPLFSVKPETCPTDIHFNAPAAIVDHLKFDEARQTFIFEQITDSLELAGALET